MPNALGADITSGLKRDLERSGTFGSAPERNAQRSTAAIANVTGMGQEFTARAPIATRIPRGGYPQAASGWRAGCIRLDGLNRG